VRPRELPTKRASLSAAKRGAPEQKSDCDMHSSEEQGAYQAEGFPLWMVEKPRLILLMVLAGRWWMSSRTCECRTTDERPFIYPLVARLLDAHWSSASPSSQVPGCHPYLCRGELGLAVIMCSISEGEARLTGLLP